MISDQELLDIVLKEGATKAALIKKEQIIFNTVFRDICKSNGCGVYGKCWMCPPDCGEVEDLMNKVRSYPKGLLYQTICELEDSFDFEGMTEGKKSHTKLSLRVDKAIAPFLPDRFHVSCGGCGICERCAKRDDLPCRFPDLAMTSLEACGIDVSGTTSSTDMKYINGQNTVTYFALVMYPEE